jgi:hypothetical protein
MAKTVESQQASDGGEQRTAEFRVFQPGEANHPAPME